jgi:hypothetical protein
MWLIGFFVVLLHPVTIVAGLVVGAAAWRKWHLIPGSVLPPLALWTYWTSYGEMLRANDALQVLPVAWVGGLVSILAAHSIRRQISA